MAAIAQSEAFVSRAEGDDAERTAAVVVVAGSKEKLIWVAVHASDASLAELNSPDVVDLDGLASRVAERAEENACIRIKGVDSPLRIVVGDEKRVAHGPKVRRGQRDSPG